MDADLQAAPRVEFLGIPLLSVTTQQFIDCLITSATKSRRERPHIITYVNAWCTVIAERDAKYCELLKLADGVYADGQAIVWASRFLDRPVPERVNAADFIVQFCRRADESGSSVYLIGSAPGVAEAAAQRWSSEVENLKFCGAESGYFDDGGEAAISRINKAQPDVLLVGLGVPLQEKWVAANLHRLSTKVVWCVGAMFEYHGKARARAPEWMRRAGLEWLFRLALEPRRLARRYLVGNVQFIFYVMRARFQNNKAR